MAGNINKYNPAIFISNNL